MTLTLSLLNCTSANCNSAALSFLAFLSHYTGFSYDDKFKFINSDDGSKYFDFIIVGGGSAGCVLANRLSENQNWKILLLEAGGEEPIVADIPGLLFLNKKEVDYGYTTQPGKNYCGNKSCKYARGKVLGGSSVLNGMQMVRGNRWDYDNWANMGNPGWSWLDVLTYFKKSEDFRIPQVMVTNSLYHGVGGYQTIEGATNFDKNAKTIMNAWEEIGLKKVDDYNSGDNLGTSRLQFSVIHGARQSSNGAYIRPIRGKRPNLTIRTNSWVTKVIIDPESKEARGVEYKTSGSDKIISAYASKEVILSAGSIDSPKILMLSGIGPVNNLRESRIKIIKELSVGKNLQNHVALKHHSVKVDKKCSSTNISMKNFKQDVIYWLNTHEGPMSVSPFMDNVAFFKTSFEKKPNVPDIQVIYVKHKYDQSVELERLSSPYYNGFMITSCYLAPKSRGEIKLNPADPTNSQPLIFPNYFSHPDDIKALAEGAKLTRRILNTRAFKNAGYVPTKVYAPNCDRVKFETFEYYQCLAKNYTIVINHPVGTCKMGPIADPEAVVDSKLRVHGISKLRVIDASIMPTLPRGNTHWPTMMIAEKGSDMIKQDWLGY